MMGHLAMAAENNAGMMLSIGKSLLDLEKINSIDEIFKQIKVVNAGELLDLANQELDTEAMSTLTYLPKSNGVY